MMICETYRFRSTTWYFKSSQKKGKKYYYEKDAKIIITKSVRVLLSRKTQTQLFAKFRLISTRNSFAERV